MGDGGWDGRLVGVEGTYSLTIWPDWTGISRERSVLFGLNKLALEMEMEKEIYVYSQSIALCTYLPNLPTYLMHNVGTSILLMIFFHSFFTGSSTLALKFSNLGNPTT